MQTGISLAQKVGICALWLMLPLVDPRSAPAQSAAGAAIADSDIALLVDQLSDPIYEKRVGATRRLCAIGTPAMEALQRASEGGDMEAALRARKVIQALDRVWFAGVEIRLESQRTSFDWNEPIELRIILENKSRFPARVPFVIGSDQSDGDTTDARQVAAMVDAAELLSVHTTQGREVELRVDEISDDPAVLHVVQQRLAGGPISRIAPGDRVTVPLPSWNRGWARYPLLDEGDYVVTLRYVPEWIDPVLAEEKIGAVQSNTLALHVSKGAPDVVSRGGAQGEISLRREGDELVASMTNRSDRLMLINTNYGVSAPFAEIQWVYERDGQRIAIPAANPLGRNWSDFEATRFAALEPGSSLVLARTRVTDLVRSLNQEGEAAAGEGGIALSYFNICDRQWQLREQANLDKDQSAPAIFRTPLPRQLLSTRLTSQSLRGWGVP